MGQLHQLHSSQRYLVTNQTYKSWYNDIELLKSYDRSVGQKIKKINDINMKQCFCVYYTNKVSSPYNSRFSNDTGPIRLEMKYSGVRRNFYQISGIGVWSAVGYRRWTVLDVSTFYATRYIGYRFEQGEHLFVQKIQIHVKSTPKMIYCKVSTCYKLVISVFNYVVLESVKTMYVIIYFL